MAAGSTYTPIATQTLGSATNSISFTSIPSTYTDLVIIVGSAKTSVSGDSVAMYFNSDTGSNYSYTYLYGNGSSASSGRGSNVSGQSNWLDASSMNPTSEGQFIINIFNYANSTTYKTSLTRVGSAANAVEAFVNLWRSTAAITRIDLKVQSTDTFSSGTTFTLYGITAA